MEELKTKSGLFLEKLFSLFFLFCNLAFGEISQIPLVLNFIGNDQNPNLMIVSDDSSSMLIEQMGISENHVEVIDEKGHYFQLIHRLFPDDLDEDLLIMAFPDSKLVTDEKVKIATMQWRCRNFNKSFYDPEQIYLPWIKHDGTRFENADPKKAYRNPTKTKDGHFDLTVSKKKNAYWAIPFMSTRPKEIEEEFFPATYYYCDKDDLNNVSKYKKVEIKPSINSYIRGVNRSDCKGFFCSYQEEIQNFANWFSYSRNRNLILRGALTEALSQVPPGAIRIGYGKIGNKTSVKVDGFFTQTIELGVRDFLSFGPDREKIFDAIFRTESPSFGANTPLVSSGKAVGKYFSRTDDQGPWSSTPGKIGGVIHPCRRSRYLISTDGDATDYFGLKDGDVGNSDNEDGPIIKGPDKERYQYISRGSPYADQEWETLADIAIHFWKNDLLPDSPNVLHSRSLDHRETVRDAFWQNVNTDALVINEPPSIDEKLIRRKIAGGASSIIWGRPGTSDDLMHAAFNSGGFFESTTSAHEVKEGFARIIKASVKQIKDGVVSTMGISKKLSSGYIATFDSSNWSGDIVAESVADKKVIWRASDNVPASEDRNITSIRDDLDKPIDFNWSEISDNQRKILKSDEVLHYLRGKRDGEISGLFRSRGKSLLGDFLGSPVVLMKENENKNIALPLKYRNEKGYDRWLGSRSSGMQALCTGGNDGMLHCFDADANKKNAGREIFAYIPRDVYTKLPELAKFSYVHQYFVSGDIKVGDVFISPSQKKEGWYKVLISGLGPGGKSFFAIDVSDLNNLDKEKILWETKPTDDDGFSVSRIDFGLFKDEEWRFITGNGPDSSNSKSFLVVRNVVDGSIHKKIEVESKSGLSSPFIFRKESGEVEFAYSGDFDGNLWKFDLRDSDPSSWSAKKIFENPDMNLKKPISVRPVVKKIDGRIWVFFGTGSILEKSDLEQKFQAKIYGLVDTDETVEEGDLQEIKINKKSVLGRTFYEVQDLKKSHPQKNGWYISLDREGERIIKDPEFDGGFIRFVTIGPPGKVDDPSSITSCAESAENSRVFILDPTTGGPDKFRLFDTDQDGKIGSSDILGLVGYLTPATFNLISHNKKDDNTELGSCLRILYSREIAGSASQILSRVHSKLCRHKRLSWRQVY